MGAVMRMNAPGMIQPFVVPFVGREALAIIDHLKGERDARIGIHNMALDADSLQSTTRPLSPHRNGRPPRPSR